MLVFIAIFFVVDLVEHIDNFIDSGMSVGSIAFYYLYTFPFFIHIAIPMSALLAVVFHFGLMNRRSEITALKAAGISLYRMTWPFLISGLFLSLLAFVFEDQVVVPANQVLTEFKKENMQRHRTRSTQILKNIDINIGDGNILHIDEYNTFKLSGSGVGLQYVEEGRLNSRADGGSIRWDGEGWWIHDLEMRDFSTGTERYSRSDSAFFQWDIMPEDLEKRKIAPGDMTFLQLLDFIGTLRISGLDTTKWEVNLYFKTAMNFTTFIVILFGIPLVAYQTRSSSFASGVGISLFVIFIYTSFLKFGETLGYAGELSPFLSVWAPNFLFLFVGIVLLLRVQK